MTTTVRADLVPLGGGDWRLISPDGSCCTLRRPPLSWIEALRAGTHGYPSKMDDGLRHALSDHRLLAQPRAEGTVLLIGGGLLAAEVALGLAQAGLDVRVSAPQAAPPQLDPQGVCGSAATAVAAWVAHRCPDARIDVAAHWTALPAGAAQLAVVATDTVQPDRAITDHLGRRWLPHLVVRAHHDLAVVGPLVDHQGGPCLACLDLAMADRDHLWPATLATLTTHAAQPEAAAAHWAGAQAAQEAAWFLRCQSTTLRDSTIEVDALHAGVARRHWSPHPDCACRYPSLGAQPTLPLAA